MASPSVKPISQCYQMNSNGLLIRNASVSYKIPGNTHLPIQYKYNAGLIRRAFCVVEHFEWNIDRDSVRYFTMTELHYQFSSIL